MSRERRSPDQARALILDAAERVFAQVTPDQVGLRDIAREAGISHALVTHYFGSYEALARATLDRRIEATRQQALRRLAEAARAAPANPAAGPGQMPLLELLLEVTEDPVMLRLVGWAILTGRADAMSGPSGSLAPIIDAMAARARVLGDAAPSRPQLELSVAAALALAFGLRVARGELEGALGRPGALAPEVLRAELPRMLWAYLLAPPRATASAGAGGHGEAGD